MHRRQLLGFVAGTAAGFSGCLGGLPSRRGTPTPEPSAGSVAGVDLPVPEEQLHGSVPRDGIPAIVDPVFGEDWSGIEIELRHPINGTKTIHPD